MCFYLQRLSHGAAVLALVTTMLLGATPSIVAVAQTTQPATSAMSSDSTIRSLQDALNKQGIAVKTDGVLNDETRAAIRKYQSQHHLPVTGEPDKATLDKLGVADRRGSTQSEQPVFAQAMPTPPASTSTQQSQTPSQLRSMMPMQPGQMQGGVMTDCPMMQGQTMHNPMMQNMMQMMQGMMQMMQTQMQQMQQMHAQMHSSQMQPGQMQMMPGQTQQGQTQPGMMMQPGQMRPGMMQPNQPQPGMR